MVCLDMSKYIVAICLKTCSWGILDNSTSMCMGKKELSNN